MSSFTFIYSLSTQSCLHYLGVVKPGLTRAEPNHQFEVGCQYNLGCLFSTGSLGSWVELVFLVTVQIGLNIPCLP